jgi:hypothetical protein
MYSVLNRNDIYQVTRFIFGKLFGVIFFSYFFSDFIIKAPILLLETTYLLVKCHVESRYVPKKLLDSQVKVVNQFSQSKSPLELSQFSSLWRL